jgi:hypothetical protein
LDREYDAANNVVNMHRSAVLSFSYTGHNSTDSDVHDPFTWGYSLIHEQWIVSAHGGNLQRFGSLQNRPCDADAGHHVGFIGGIA